MVQLGFMKHSLCNETLHLRLKMKYKSFLGMSIRNSKIFSIYVKNAFGSLPFLSVPYSFYINLVPVLKLISNNK